MANNKIDNRWQGVSWDFFGLSYAHWLVLPRLMLQSMPPIWQKRFFSMVTEMYDKLDKPYPEETEFVVLLKRNNKFVKNDIPSYRHNLLKLKK